MIEGQLEIGALDQRVGHRHWNALRRLWETCLSDAAAPVTWVQRQAASGASGGTLRRLGVSPRVARVVLTTGGLTAWRRAIARPPGRRPLQPA